MDRLYGNETKKSRLRSVRFAGRRVEILQNSYDFTPSFAVASLLTMLALLTLAGKAVLARRAQPSREESQPREFGRLAA
jgi:ABC-type sulfate transport system permease subunit